MTEKQIKRGDIYWYEYDGAYMSEQGGMRPCVIVSNDKANEHSPIITAVPLTSARKKHLPTHALLRIGKVSVALCEQIYSISKDRIGDYIATCTEKEMRWIDQCLQIQLGLWKSPELNEQREPQQTAD